jgi:heptosyltransferase-3
VHLASALNTPVVGLYGPNTPQLYGPWGENGLALYANLDCSPCITNFNSKLNTCRHPRGGGACMRELSAEMVFSAIERTYLIPSAPHRLARLVGAVT